MQEDASLRLAIDETIRLELPDSSWPQKFANERDRLTGLFPRAFVAIEHIGSTAVPLLPAKPVIDFMAGVRSITEADDLLPLLCQSGYTTSADFNATLIDRRWLMKHADGRRTHHLHLLLFASDEWEKRINFRDRLRANPSLREKYQALKERLAKSAASDRELYTAGKTEFIEMALL